MAPRLTSRLYTAERRLTAIAIAVMGTVVFLDVIHRVASRETSVQAQAAVLLGAMLLTYAALRTRSPATGRARHAASAVGVVVAGKLLLIGFVAALPNGLVWGQTFALVLMLGVALIGASMATYERRHLALDIGSKLWPKRALPVVQAVGNAVTGLFCMAMTVLTAMSVRNHYGDWAETDGAGGNFIGFGLPRFVAFTVIPVGFAFMAARSFMQARESLQGKMNDDDALRMLGLAADAESGESAARADGSGGAA